jgi:hypothetical protein
MLFRKNIEILHIFHASKCPLARKFAILEYKASKLEYQGIRHCQ